MGLKACKSVAIKDSNITKEELQNCVCLGMNVKQMAEKFNLSTSNILEFLYAFGVDFQSFEKVERECTTKSLKDLWESGYYSSDTLSDYQDIHKCSLCGTDSKKIDVHHIDENHNNWLITNLEPLCVHCHQKFHYKHYKMPYASITVESHFSSGHFLPSYSGACHRCHAHGWKYSVTVRKRLNPDTGMVMDYKDLKKCLKQMEDIIDHRMLNDILPFEPTSENVAVWMWEYLSKRLLLKGIVEIKLYESENCYTTITVEDMLSRCKECHSKDIFIKEID